MTNSRSRLIRDETVSPSSLFFSSLSLQTSDQLDGVGAQWPNCKLQKKKKKKKESEVSRQLRKSTL